MKKLSLLLLFINLGLHAQENTLVVLDTKGHQALVKNIMFSDDGKKLYSISDDKTIKVWDVDAGYLITTYRGYNEMGPVGMLNSGALSTDGSMIAVGGFMGNGEDVGVIRIHETTSGKSMGLLTGNDNSVVALQFDTEDAYLYSGSTNGLFGIWDLSTATGVTLKAHSGGLYGLAVSPDGETVLTSGYDGKSVLWNVAKMRKSGEPEYIILEEKHTAEIRNCSYSPTGEYFVTVGFDNLVLLWNKEGEFVKEIDKIIDPNYGEKYGVGDINCVSFSENGKKIVIGTNLTTKENAIVYEIPSGKKLQTFAGHTNSVISSDFYGNDLIATAGGDDREIILWSASTGEVKSILKGSGKRMWEIAAGPNYQIAFGQEKANSQRLNEFGTLSKLYDLSQVDMGELPDDLSAFTSEVIDNGSFSIDYSNSQPTKVTISNGNEIEISPNEDGSIRTISISPDGNIVVGCSYRTKMFDTQGKELKEFMGHTADVYGLAFSHDGKFMYTCSGDQSIKIWDMSDKGDIGMTYEEFISWLKENYGEDAIEKVGGDAGARKLYDDNFSYEVKPLASIFVSEDDEWICWTRDNYYATSGYGSRYVGFHVNQKFHEEAKYFEFEQFDIQFNRPHRVLQTLGTGSDELIATFTRAYEKRISKLNYTEQDVNDLNAPTLTLRMDNQVVEEEVIKLRFTMADNREYLSKIYITNNDVPTTGKDGKKFWGLDSTSHMIYDVNEPLLPGENKIQLWCVNTNGVRSNRETVRVFCKVPEKKPNLYIIGLGASTYENEKMNLNYAAKDVRDFVNFYHKNNEVYDKIYVDTLTNENVTLENIVQILERSKESKITDHLLIYIAGHGLLDANLDYYLATHDIDFNAPNKKGLSYNYLEEIIDEIPARTKTIFIDACHSGELDKDEVQLSTEDVALMEDITFRNAGTAVKSKSGVGFESSFALMKNIFTDLREQSGATVIASAGGAEYAFEGDKWNNGVFTYAMLEGLKSGDADLNGDKKIMLSELREFLQGSVSKLTKGNQRPISRSENLSNDYVFWVLN